MTCSDCVWPFFTIAQKNFVRFSSGNSKGFLFRVLGCDDNSLYNSVRDTQRQSEKMSPAFYVITNLIDIKLEFPLRKVCGGEREQINNGKIRHFNRGESKV